MDLLDEKVSFFLLRDSKFGKFLWRWKATVSRIWVFHLQTYSYESATGWFWNNDKCFHSINLSFYEPKRGIFFISKENSSKWIKSFSKYKPFKWNFESLVALRPTLPISCLGHYRGLTKCSENKSKIKIAVFNLPTKLQPPVQIAWH